ncbi:hypothetical protein Pmani_007823 [Petrolisthes manimaculis]|uniref:Nuclease HARBI1 n=1 Tax=Petrolisthes manimaculis TaxID=1843537 RepID=A0AAE1QA28_9EUCA|nr:hypothetical protein Pmani_007823 [Petrolisthes manimaculis]
MVPPSSQLTANMQNDHHWLQMRNMRRMEERVRVRLRRRIVPDRSNPFEDLAEEEFLLRFRLSKECVLNLLENITEQLPIAADARGCLIPQHLQVLIPLRCMATGGHQLTISDCYGVSQTSVSKCLRTVTPTIAQMARDYVKMPTGLDVIRVMEGFRDIADTDSDEANADDDGADPEIEIANNNGAQQAERGRYIRAYF